MLDVQIKQQMQLSNLNIFEQTLITNDLVKKISIRKLPILKQY
jgi:hypothetical protein